MATKQSCMALGCDWRGSSDDTLRAPSPFFDSRETLYGCPACKAVNSLYLVCDEPECWDLVAYGTPTSDGYRSTCSKHKPRTVAG